MKDRTNWRAALAAAAWIALGAGPAAAHADDIHVLATGALHGAFDRLAPAFEQSSGHRLKIEWGPSYGTSPEALPMRVRNGEAVDICFMIKPALEREVDAGRFDRGRSKTSRRPASASRCATAWPCPTSARSTRCAARC